MRNRPHELEDMREDGCSVRIRDEFRASAARAAAEWGDEHPVDLDAVLDWIESLRSAFGDSPVDRRPWRGHDFRI